jgi:hypothetical protein
MLPSTAALAGQLRQQLLSERRGPALGGCLFVGKTLSSGIQRLQPRLPVQPRVYPPWLQAQPLHVLHAAHACNACSICMSCRQHMMSCRQCCIY